MIGVIEFLRKAKAICAARSINNNGTACDRCPMYDVCFNDINEINDEADLVREVMTYQIQEEFNEH